MRAGIAAYFFVFSIFVVVLTECAGGYSYSSSSSSSNATSKSGKSHALIVGGRVLGDRCVYKEHIVKDSSWFRIVTHEQVYNVSKYERITQVKATDRATDGNGARASLLGGGPGFSSAKLRLKSQRGHGIDYDIEIYARP
ncbi:probable salivary secreted peptide [Venturia canescens]|uniref:probable salivary secreted peptide n=1 Tax=Venturia canescens TaxID=32260 RepID=UPI001C9D0C92|nr:probable salivary secreted peptide [Venturia canescens]